MIIDAHAHIGMWNEWRVKSKPGELVEMLRNEGIDYALISSLDSIMCDFKRGNREVLQAAKKFKQLIPLACLNPWYMEESLAEIENYREKGFVGVKLHPFRQKYVLSSSIAEPILKKCEEEKIAILAHCEEWDIYSGSNQIQKVAQKHSDLTLIIGHGGIFASPYAVEIAKDYPNIYIDISVNYETAKLERTIEILGTDKLVFGSDAPLHHPSVMLKRLRLVGLSKDDEEKILHRTAEKIFKLNLS